MLSLRCRVDGLGMMVYGLVFMDDGRWKTFIFDFSPAGVDLRFNPQPSTINQRVIPEANFQFSILNFQL